MLTHAGQLFGWWSHDIGGFMEGEEDGELFTRWVQFGVFSPILRMHSVKTKWIDRRPWLWPDLDVQANVRAALQLRHALVPYLYSMAWRNVADNKVLVRPMYHEHPASEVAYCHPNQYYFGSELLVAPFVAAAEPLVGLSRAVVWLPPGAGWYDYFTGEYLAGGQVVPFYAGLARVPVFARAGAIVPTQPPRPWGGLEAAQELDLQVFAGADGRFRLYEDDGTSQRYLAGAFALTDLRLEWREGGGPQAQEQRLRLLVPRALGDTSVLPAHRSFSVRVTGVREATAAVTRNGEALAVEQRYDAARETLTISGIHATPQDDLEVALAGPALLARRPRLAEKFEAMLRAFRLESYAKDTLDRYLGSAPSATGLLQLVDHVSRASPALFASLREEHLFALLELLTGAGVDVVTGADVNQNLVVAFNSAAADVDLLASFAEHQRLEHRCFALSPAQEHSGTVTYFGNRRKAFFVPRG